MFHWLPVNVTRLPESLDPAAWLTAALALASTRYLARLLNSLRTAWVDHVNDPDNRPTWLVLWATICAEADTLIANRPAAARRDICTDYHVHIHPEGSDWHAAKIWLALVRSAAATSPFTISYTGLLLAMVVASAGAWIDSGTLGLTLHLWLLVAIGRLGHQITNPRRIAPMRKLLLTTSSTFSALLALAAFDQQPPAGRVSQALILLSALLAVIVGTYTISRLCARTKRAIIRARHRYAAMLRALVAFGTLIVMPMHVQMIFDSALGAATRLSLVAFTAINLWAWAHRVRSRREGPTPLHVRSGNAHPPPKQI